MKVGVVGSGEYINKDIVLHKLNCLIDVKEDIIVSGHSPRNKYNNVDIWAEDWANEFCQNEPIIHPAEEFNKKEFFLRNKKIAIEVEKLLVFINRHQFKSGAWNTVKHFINKKDFKYSDLIIYDQYGKLWRTDELPSWLYSKVVKDIIN